MSGSSTESFEGTLLDIAPGSSLGPYELLVPVAAGGMARVWAARRRDEPDKILAVKMILPELSADEDFQKMFGDEARIASMVRHPNVCETYELAETKGIHYLVMQWVDGASLHRLLRMSADDEDRVPIEPRMAARIIADACAGLHAAHELKDAEGKSLNVVHRDATPHNILLMADGRVKMSDFGIAKAMGQSHATMAGQIKGKISYMAPEQLCGDPLDRRVDVFALGVSLYECVVGEKAFQGASDPEIMSAIVLGQMRPPREVRPMIPEELEAIILRSLALQPDERYRTAAELRAALIGFLGKKPRLSANALASLVTERCGNEVAQRADNIRVACTDPSALDLPDDAFGSPAREGGQTSESGSRRRRRDAANASAHDAAPTEGAWIDDAPTMMQPDDEHGADHEPRTLALPHGDPRRAPTEDEPRWARADDGPRARAAADDAPRTVMVAGDGPRTVLLADDEPRTVKAAGSEPRTVNAAENRPRPLADADSNSEVAIIVPPPVSSGLLPFDPHRSPTYSQSFSPGSTGAPYGGVTSSGNGIRRWGVLIAVALFAALLGVAAGGLAFMRMKRDADEDVRPTPSSLPAPRAAASSAAPTISAAPASSVAPVVSAASVAPLMSGAPSSAPTPSATPSATP